MNQENTEKLWRNNGFENPADQFDPTKKDQKIAFRELVDALATPDASILIGKVVSNIVKEAIEPFCQSFQRILQLPIVL